MGNANPVNRSDSFQSLRASYARNRERLEFLIYLSNNLHQHH